MKQKNRNTLAACICSVLALASPTLRAQSTVSATPDDGRNRGEIMEKVAQALDLTDEQKTDIKSIIEQRRTKIAALREDKSVPPQQKMAQAKEIFRASMQQIKGMLTPDQQQKLEQIIARVKERREGEKPQ